MRRSLLLIVLFLFALPVIAKTVVLRNLTVENNPHTYRVSFYLSSSTHYRTFMLHHPNRYIIDLKNVKAYKPLHLSLSSRSPIKNFRYATHHNGVFRIVLGLHSSQMPITKIDTDPKNHGVTLHVVFQSSKSLVKLVKPIKTAQSTLISAPAFSRSEEKTMITEVNSEDSSYQRRNVIIVIDPGHGGKDPGATGPGGAHEKNIVLSISTILQRLINRQPGFHAVLTRTGDYYLTLRQRLAIARKYKADMFIAIHADMYKNTKARGVSIFALSQRGATSEAARWLATQENASELMGGVDLHDKSHLLKSVLINLSQSATIRSSLEIGNDLMHSVSKIARLHYNRVEQAAFVVLKSPDIPSLLVETGFLSNQQEERRLSNIAYQTQLANALMRGINGYFISYPPRNTWLSYWRDHSDARRA